MAVVNPLNPLSYTNRDFQEIFPEQLNLVKNLTDKWDPSQSNESDPGVLLLKANAVIADKNNYQIDKNILELSPLTVTQDANARKLFNQLGYNMHWYSSATTTVTLKWVQEEEDMETDSDIIVIPPFTMVSDSGSNLIYTLLGMVSNVGTSDSLKVKDNYPNKFIGNILLPNSGETVEVAAIQGTVNSLDVLNETRITFDRISSDNRLYFNTSDVAQNGIFIENANPRNTNVGLGNFADWKRVDNIVTQNLSEKVFTFGVDADTGSCYIEFSENIATEIGAGIYVYYITSNGLAGNTSARSIENFYGGPSGTYLVQGGTVELTSSNVLLRNLNAATNGADPESISQAYKNYRKTVGTFNTLVTTIDYQNSINKSNLVSNSFVCDRNNDLQCSYKVVSKLTDDASIVKSKVLNDANGTPYMTAFDLKIYPLKYVEDTSDVDNYNESFKMDISSTKKDILESYVNDERCISHDFKEVSKNIQTPALDAELFTNEYSINCKVIPQYELTKLQVDEVTSNIKKALYSKLSSKEIDFGEEPDYDTIYDIIVNSDERIKTIFLEDFDYTTYFNYNNNGTDTYLPLLGDSNKQKEVQTQVVARSILAGNTQLFDNDNTFSYSLDQTMNSLIEDVEAIDTETVIDVPAGEGKIRANESVVFEAPLYETDVTYSSYVRYIYRLTDDTLQGEASFSADSVFQLQGNDCIITFRRSSSNDRYEYNKYSAGDYVKCSFVLSNNASEHKNDNIINYCNSKHGLVTNYEYEDWIYNLSYDEASLGDSKSITILSPAKTELNSGKCYCYWFLTSADTEGNFVLFDAVSTEDTTDNEKTQTYTLGSGEYFAYTTSDKVNLTVVGQGTKISRTTAKGSSSPVWAVKPVALTAITQSKMDGINTSIMFQFDGGNTPVTVQKMQNISLPENSLIKISEKTTPASYASFRIKKTGLYGVDSSEIETEISISDVIVTYKLPESSSFSSLPELVFNNEGGWTVKSLLSLGITSEISQKIVSGQKVICDIKDNTSKTIIEGTDEGIDILSNYVVLMTGENKVNTTFVDAKGNIKYLNLYTFEKKDSTDNITYSSNASTSLTFKVSRSSATGTISSKVLNINGLYTNPDSIYAVLTSGENSESITVSGDMVYNSSGEACGVVTLNANGSVSKITFNDATYDGYSCTYYYNSSSEVSVTFKVPQGNYMLPLILTQDKQSVLVKSGSSDVSDIAGNTRFDLPKAHYLSFSSNGTSATTLAFTLYDGHYDTANPGKTVIQEKTINLLALFKYKNRESFVEGDTNNQNLINLISRIDQSNIYDYTYRVNVSDNVDNPLLSASFNDINHVMNPYTINKINDINIVVSTRTR